MGLLDKIFQRQAGGAELLPLEAPQVVSPETLLTPTHQLPSLFLGLDMGTTLTKRAALCQLGNELLHWNPETGPQKTELSVFRIEKVFGEGAREISLGEEAFTNFLGDRGDPPCTLFFQPLRYVFSKDKMDSFVTTHEGQKILHQSPSNKDLFQYYFGQQLKFLWERSRDTFAAIRRFQIGQIVVAYPDCFSEVDLDSFQDWLVEAAMEFFPPGILGDENATKEDIAPKFMLLPESVVTLLHWITDQIGTKMTAQDIELKKTLLKMGMLPRIDDPIYFLVVTMGATHSRVIRVKIPSFNRVASVKRVGENVPLAHIYLGRTSFGGDYIGCMFLDEEEERRYGATLTHRVSIFTRKVLNDWEKISSPEGRKHFEALCGEMYKKEQDKLIELTAKGFVESPENTMILLGGKVFSIPYFRDSFKYQLNHIYRVPQCRILTTSNEALGISRVCEIAQYHAKGLGRAFDVKPNRDIEGQIFNWRVGKLVENYLVDIVLEPDNKDWNEENPREFTVPFEPGVKVLSLGYQKTAMGLSYLWCNISLKAARKMSGTVMLTFKTTSPTQISIVNVRENPDGVKSEDFFVEVMMSGEHPSNFPLFAKLFKAH